MSIKKISVAPLWELLTCSFNPVIMKISQVGQGTATRLVRIEESPHSTEHNAGQHPGWSNPSDRATETVRFAR
ncbi:MAG TPA: hypothetical protein VMC62_06180, partial [Longilinea sp.]|nr:hypothetical protein [Longilinea sp.]